MNSNENKKVYISWISATLSKDALTQIKALEEDLKKIKKYSYRERIIT